MMPTRDLIRLYGLLDLGVIVWIIFSALGAGKYPFLTDLTEALEVARAFGMPGSAMLAVIPVIGSISLIASGVLLFLRKRPGAYLALFQAPLRVLLIIQPSLFFLALVKGDGIIYAVQIAVILAFEIFKTVSIVVWIRKTRRPTS